MTCRDYTLNIKEDEEEKEGGVAEGGSKEFKSVCQLPINRIANRPSVTDRYFEPRFFIPKVDQIQNHLTGHQCVLLHSNRFDYHLFIVTYLILLLLYICLNRIGVICLAPSHPILAQNKLVIEIDFKIDERIDRSNNKVSGKFKKGAQKLDPESILCNISCEDGSSYTLMACMKGKLVEINDNLILNPNLLKEQVMIFKVKK
jgi:UPF0436 protein C9orf6 homolog